MISLKNSQGSIAIFLVLGLILMSVAVAGGAFYINSNYLNSTASSESSEATENLDETRTSTISANLNNQKPKSTATPSATAGAGLSGRIYYFSLSQGEIKELKRTTPNSPNSEKIQSFIPSLKKNENFLSLGTSPDRSLVILKTRFTAESYPLSDNGGEYYYLLSKSGDIKKLNYDKIVTPLLSGKSIYGSYTIKGFSTDGKKLVGTIALWEEGEVLVFDYDLATEKSTEIFRPDLDLKNYVLDILFYDPEKQLLAYRSFKPKDQQNTKDPMGNTIGNLVNLKDKTTTNFDDPIFNIEPQSNLNFTNFINGNPYFIVTNKNPQFVPSGESIGNLGYYTYNDRRSLWINSFYNPTARGREVKLDAPEDLTYGNGVLWSSDFNYFAVEVHSNSSSKEDNYLYIYSRLGKFVAKVEASSDNFFGIGAFSSDNRYLLTNDYIGSWKIFDINAQKYLESPLTPAGTALYWES